MAKDLEPLSFGARLWLSFIMPWRLLFDGVFAARVDGLSDGTPALESAEDEPEKKEIKVTEAEPDETPALQVLAILQREGRFVDFLNEDVSSFSDEEIGAAARVVHEGCKRGLEDYVEFARIRDEDEGQDVTLEEGYDAARNRVTGNVVGDPPFKGKLAHHGWQVKTFKVPKLTKGHDPKILAPAEVEL